MGSNDFRRLLALAALACDSELKVAASGAGKSTCMGVELAPVARTRSAAIVVKDKQGMLCRWIAWLGWLLGFSSQIVYARLASPSQVFAGICMRIAASVNEYEYRRNVEIAAQQVLSVIWSIAARDGENPEVMALLMKWLPLGIRIILCRQDPVPLSHLKFLFLLGSPRCRELVQTCTDAEACYHWAYLFRLWESKATSLLDREIGSSQRLIFRIMSTVFGAHCGTTGDIEAVLDQRKVLLLDGSGLPMEMARAIYRGFDLRLYQSQFEHYERTHRPRLVLDVQEEAVASGALGPITLNMFREGNKTGWKPKVLVQELGALSPEQQEVVLGNTNMHTWYNPGSYDKALFAGRDVALEGLDPNYVERQRIRDRQVHGDEKVVKKKGKTKTLRDGKYVTTETETETTVPQWVNVQEIEIDYRRLDDQILLKAQQLVRMGKGWFMRTHKGEWGLRVSEKPEYCPLPDDPYAEYGQAFRDRKIEEVIEQSQRLHASWFTQPRVETFDTEATPVIRIRPPNGTTNGTPHPPQPTGNGNGMNGRRGMS